MTEKANVKRTLYFDILRILATVAVITLHVAAQNWNTVRLDSVEWTVFNLFDSAVRWSVPVFVMISGALFLDCDKPFSIRKLYTGNIFRIITAFIFWSAVYAANQAVQGADLKTAVMAFVEGNYHMWFLFMIIGLYVVTPILRKITENKKITEYFLLAGLIFTFLIPRTLVFLKCADIPHTASLLESLNAVYSDIHFHLTAGYTFYYVLGLYLAKYDISAGKRRIAYLLSILGFIATAALTDWYSVKIGKASEIFYSYFSIGVMLMSAGLFLFAKYVLSKIQFGKKGEKILLRMSKCTFGVYLVHVLVIMKFKDWLGLTTLTVHPVLSVLIIVFGAFLVSYILSAILNRIPVLKKYIV